MVVGFTTTCGMASAEVYNLVEFYYFSASEIRPAKMDGL
jgi:hypothetical protein